MNLWATIRRIRLIRWALHLAAFGIQISVRRHRHRVTSVVLRTLQLRRPPVL